MTKHTEGPWALDYEQEEGAISICPAEGGLPFAEVYINDGDPEEAEATARLIAAAPDLLAALCNLMGEVTQTQAGLAITSALAREHARKAIQDATKGA